jgi:hypothetical protein
MDLFLFSTLFSLIWNIFTVLFVLYRFTSFFTYMFGFIRFCGRIAINTKYYFNRLFYRNSQYIRLPDDHENEEDAYSEPLITNNLDNQTSIWSRMKSATNAVTNYFWPSSTVPEPVAIPMHQSTLKRPSFKTSVHPDINNGPSKQQMYPSSSTQLDSHALYDPNTSSVDRHTPTFYSNFINTYKDVVFPFAIQNQPFHQSEDSNSSQIEYEHPNNIP